MQPTPESLKKELKQELKKRWNIEADHWIPLSDPSMELDEEVVYFPQNYFFNDYGIDGLKLFIAEFARHQIFQWNWEVTREEFYSIEVEEMVAFENLEKYYFDETCNWIVYVSHENTIAFGGQSFIESLIKKWTNWSMYLNEWEAIN